jgi:hypothetical protein
MKKHVAHEKILQDNIYIIGELRETSIYFRFAESILIIMENAMP